MKDNSLAISAAELEFRVPYKMFTTADGSVMFRWIYVGRKRFTEPFFEDVVSACLSLPENGGGRMPVTSADTLMQWSAALEPVPVAGFIYHVSRCGSTLLAQMLSEDPACVILSEVPLLDDVLRLPFNPNVRQQIPVEELFMAVLRILGQKRDEQVLRVFVKTDSWHVLFHKQLRSWYPEIPFFLMYRTPVEVADSHAKRSGIHVVPGILPAELFGMNSETVATIDPKDYLSHVLACYYRRYITIITSDKHATLLAYADGAEHMLSSVLRICNFRIASDVSARMKIRAGFHSKVPGVRFTGDEAVKHHVQISEEALKAYQDLRAIHEQLQQAADV